jgi:hypothetical protein
MDLAPGQRDRLRQLLEDELREAYRKAIDRGASPAAVDEDVASRRRALEALTRRFVADDVQDPVDEPSEGGGVAEQR